MRTTKELNFYGILIISNLNENIDSLHIILSLIQLWIKVNLLINVLSLEAKCFTFDVMFDFFEIFGALSSNQKESRFLISGSSIESFLIISCCTPAKTIYSFKLMQLVILN